MSYYSPQGPPPGQQGGYYPQGPPQGYDQGQYGGPPQGYAGPPQGYQPQPQPQTVIIQQQEEKSSGCCGTCLACFAGICCFCCADVVLSYVSSTPALPGYVADSLNLRFQFLAVAVDFDDFMPIQLLVFLSSDRFGSQGVVNLGNMASEAQQQLEDQLRENYHAIRLQQLRVVQRFVSALFPKLAPEILPPSTVLAIIISVDFHPVV
ncbi:hypothetical protein IW261DRAFT_1604978 [Armillaria novae-zelandiae]|uniref:Cysteine-rich transmembrane CYSTM domain-containing protein n=1 Tax=Armillaria novae-zelandiae TaxID=153914 RepID=A0AA39PIM8_9AGAR|nr:hypothetical protein IW261DRAFT_1604978 [Armillaria novae-zelandiae]